MLRFVAVPIAQPVQFTPNPFGSTKPPSKHKMCSSCIVSTYISSFFSYILSSKLLHAKISLYHDLYSFNSTRLYLKKCGTYTENTFCLNNGFGPLKLQFTVTVASHIGEFCSYKQFFTTYCSVERTYLETLTYLAVPLSEHSNMRVLQSL